MLSSTARTTSGLIGRSLKGNKTATAPLGSTLSGRWKSTDAGDVIGIDLETTNSCVAIMVRNSIIKYMYMVWSLMGGD